MLRQITTTVVCLAASCSMALAQQSVATAGAVRGSVVVNHGTGFVRLSADTPLTPGDRLMAKPGGRTTIVYADGCAVKVKPGSTVTVAPASPCSKFVAQVPERDGGLLPPVAPAPTGLYLVGGALAAGGIAAGVVLATQNHGNAFVNPVNNNGFERRQPISP